MLATDPLPGDCEVLSLIRKYSGIQGKYLIMETGFSHDRTIDAVKELVLRNVVHVDFSNYPRFWECRFYAK
ncbi:hypothetical protein NTE_01894 [Candidatus Nitrososphaera evergladensis SR1]|uniref:Uncharacterized protein n=1 Tax=Candidatus Nitrososphaera evergladensis SR1 TaxID=1459636 RepID=A0A075MS09_9ARCH|nr:hypothetical protein NTE_01894 [Candidatus Nitrososphaera evergladensis SR1]